VSKGEGSVAVSGGIERQKDVALKTPTAKTSFTKTQIKNTEQVYPINIQEKKLKLT